MLRTKHQQIKLKKIIKEGMKYKKLYGNFIACIELIDDRMLVINEKENNEYAVYLLDMNKTSYRRIVYAIYVNDIKSGLQRALLENKYKVAIV